MPPKTNSNFVLYGIDIETGEFFELPKAQIVNIEEMEEAMEETRKHDDLRFGCDFSGTIELSGQEIAEFIRRFFPDKINNYRRLHGMKPLRKKHFFSKRWYGK